MTKRNEVYKCDKCGNLVSVVHGAGGDLVCCGEKMKLLAPNSVDAAQEKHVPVIEKKGPTVTVKVGSAAHPMEEKHFIETISVLTASRLYRVYLKPGDKPEAAFDVDGEIQCARAYCNLHGLWKSK